MHRLDIQLNAPFPLGRVGALVELQDRSRVFFDLEEGAGCGQLPQRPARLFLRSQAPPQGSVRMPRPVEPGAARDDETRRIVAVTELFDRGVELSGEVQTVELCWLGDCLTEQEEGSANDRFSAAEHFAAARYVGRAAVGDDAPLEIGGKEAWFDYQDDLPVGDTKLTFGEILGLAGDYYAHFDDSTARRVSFAWEEMPPAAAKLAAPPLARDSKRNIHGLSNLARSASGAKERARSALASFGTLDRYLALAAYNYCHFANPEPANPSRHDALRTYTAYHLAALEQARRAAEQQSRQGLRGALAVDAFGCHFLTDAFASGHMRALRRLLAEQHGVLRGALHMAKRMHDEDNALGLWCTAGTGEGDRRVVWRACGDGALLRPDNAGHLARIQEAVRRSAAELFAVFVGEDFPYPEKAAELVPRPLDAGTGPESADLVDPTGSAWTPNHWPLYEVDAQGIVRERRAGPFDADPAYESVNEIESFPPLPELV